MPDQHDAAPADDCGPGYPEGGLFGSLTSAVVECADLPRVERFYTDVLGLPAVLRGEGWVCICRPPGEIVLWQGGKSELVPAFMGAQVAAAHAAAAERGLEPSPVVEHPGGTHFYVRDPDGRQIQVGDQ